MENEKLLNGLAVVAANYAKRLLEDPYDQLFQTEIGQKIKCLDGKTKHLIELLSYVLTAFLDERLKDDSPLKKFIFEVGTDVAPELSRRLINGSHDGLSTNVDPKQGDDLVRILLGIDDNALLELLKWLDSVDTTERPGFIKHLSRLSSEEIQSFLRMTPQNRSLLYNLIAPKNAGTVRPSKFEREIENASSRLNEMAKRIRRK